MSASCTVADDAVSAFGVALGGADGVSVEDIQHTRFTPRRLYHVADLRG